VNELERVVQQEGLVQKHHKHLLIAGSIVAALAMGVCVLAVWLLKDRITPNQLILVPVTANMLMYVIFTAFSVYVCLTSKIMPSTTAGGKLLWWHGAGWIILMALSVVLTIVVFGAIRLAGLTI